MSTIVKEAPESLEPLCREMLLQMGQLPGDFEQLREGVRLLASIADRDPEMALTRARKILELVICDVYERRCHEPPGKRDLIELIDRLYKEGSITPLVQANSHYVRNLGNVGAHGVKSRVTAAEVGFSLRQLMPVLEWYLDAKRSGALDRTTDQPSQQLTAVKVATKATARPTIVPKGLRPFDAADARFFLQLLPGAVDEKGLPDAIRFWKHRIETTDELTFTVAAIYGPSGCGKSSLVKAGLVPNLDQRIVSVYIEATAEDTEARLLASLRRKLPNLSQDLDLKQTIAALRRGAGLTKKQKVLIALDQFEQWLHARRGEENTELAQALRQCDGERVQCVVLLRDDFWLAISRFAADLNISLVPGENMMLVDLFDVCHARRVLAAFGVAFGKLEDPPTAEQSAFLDRATGELAEDGRVVCVRLALFAEMIKDKEWAIETLAKVGGFEGLGANFLEETFSAASADAKRRYHQIAARAVLKALLPEAGSNIRGQMRPLEALREASGYQERPQDFAELIRMLDSELRLITPTHRVVSDGTNDAGELTDGAAQRYYQLTHDYLVPALREWLMRKQRESRRGRAGLLIESRASMWKIKREDRFLPTPREFFVIRTLTNPRDWTGTQREMMERAKQVHRRRGVAALGMLIVLGIVAVFVRGSYIEGRESRRAESLVETLLGNDISKVSDTIKELGPYRRWADPLLQRAFADRNLSEDDRSHAAFALPYDPERQVFLCNRVLTSKLETLPALCQLLAEHHYEQGMIPLLWRALGVKQTPPEQRFNATCALATFLKNDANAGGKWEDSAAFTAEWMVATVAANYERYNLVVETLRPIRKSLAPALAEYFVKTRPTFPEPAGSRHALAASFLADYESDSPEALAESVADADPESFVKLFNNLAANGDRGIAALKGELDRTLAKPIADEIGAIRQANTAVSLYLLGQPEKISLLLKKSADPRVRGYLIHRIYQFGKDTTSPADPKLLLKLFDQETDPSVNQAILLALGEFPKGALSPAAQSLLVDRLALLYRDENDPGLHAAAEWLLRKWDEGKRLGQLDEQLAARDEQLERRQGRAWYVNREKQTMVIVRGPASFRIGSPATERNRDPGKVELQHEVPLGHSFAIDAHEVTIEEFLRFSPNHKYDENVARDITNGQVNVRCPVNRVSWYRAASYCDWLSKQDGIAPDQWCYPLDAHDEFVAGMKPFDDFLNRAGYRLPTEAEWEFACRAGTTTARYFGQTDELLAKYAWFQGNSNKISRAVGLLKPNDFGLFDMLGNALEWCEDASPSGRDEFGFPPDAAPIIDSVPRVARGEKFLSLPENVRAARRDAKHSPSNQDFILGFRPVRTYPTGNSDR